MGTRNLICVFYKGRFVLAQYTQYDGYPEGQGFKILKFLLDSANIERLKNGIQHIYMISEQMVEMLNVTAQDCSVEGIRVETPVGRLWPSLSRTTGARILELVAQATAEDPLPIKLDLDYANSWNLEWWYVVDLDDSVFEVFCGQTKKETAKSKRFNEVGEKDELVPMLVKSFSFDELTTEEDFIAALDLDVL